jgi:hypothetical protein
MLLSSTPFLTGGTCRVRRPSMFARKTVTTKTTMTWQTRIMMVWNGY